MSLCIDIILPFSQNAEQCHQTVPSKANVEKLRNESVMFRLSITVIVYVYFDAERNVQEEIGTIDILCNLHKATVRTNEEIFTHFSLHAY